MLERNNDYQLRISDRTLFEEMNSGMTNAYRIGHAERNKVIGEVVGNWISKLRNISRKSIGFGVNVSG